MPRGKKNLTLEEQDAKLTKEIELSEEHLKELKKEKKNLEEQIRKNRLAELDNLISEKGLSIEDVKAMLDK